MREERRRWEGWRKGEREAGRIGEERSYRKEMDMESKEQTAIRESMRKRTLKGGREVEKGNVREKRKERKAGEKGMLKKTYREGERSCRERRRKKEEEGERSNYKRNAEKNIEGRERSYWERRNIGKKGEKEAGTNETQ